MRFLYVFLAATALSTFGSTFAFSYGADSPANYAGCVCHYGYGDECTEVVTCGTSGGRCLKACRLPRDYFSR